MMHLFKAALLHPRRVLVIPVLALFVLLALAWCARAGECLPSAAAVWKEHPGSHASWEGRSHPGRQCWFAEANSRWHATGEKQPAAKSSTPDAAAAPSPSSTAMSAAADAVVSAFAGIGRPSSTPGSNKDNAKEVMPPEHLAAKSRSNQTHDARPRSASLPAGAAILARAVAQAPAAAPKPSIWIVAHRFNGEVEGPVNRDLERALMREAATWRIAMGIAGMMQAAWSAK